MDYNRIYEEYQRKKLKIIKPQKSKTSSWTDLSNVKNSIFLAGPCPRSDYANNDWRTDAFNILENLLFDGYVITPTNDMYNPDNTDFLKNQTDWEWEAMHKASAIIFYCGRSEKNPGFTTNCELFDYIRFPNIFVCIPKDDTNGANRYIKLHCEHRGVPVFETLEDTLSAATMALKEPQKVWYTSDTHFGQERTLNFSKRPFKTVKDMDLELISWWNKNVTMNDVVYHLGDFGDNGKYLDCLNFKKLIFNKGNYERDEKNPDVLKDMKKRNDVEIYNNDEIEVDSGIYHYILRHEPITGKKVPKGSIVLFGHVHGRGGFGKRNGIDVSVDYHGFKPVSQSEVDWFANCLEKGYYDDNVFCEECH